ncbi:MAG TPA: hypothetical protein VKU39_15330 [Streptosporangiaceae bacterium]|nr:hypothetical protein [Streptosporangiaceae bacterium]
MRITPEARRRLASYLDARRKELAFATWEAVAAAADVSDKTLYSIREGNGGVSLRTLHKLEAALRLAPGSLEAVIDDREPVPMVPAAADTAAILFPGDEVAQQIWRLDLPVAAREREVAGWRRVQDAGPADQVIAAIWLQVHKPDDVRLREIASWRQIQAGHRDTAVGLRKRNEPLA